MKDYQYYKKLLRTNRTVWYIVPKTLWDRLWIAWLCIILGYSVERTSGIFLMLTPKENL